MDINTINRIVWWIPFKQIRNDIRNLLYEIKTNLEHIYPVADSSHIVNNMLKDFQSSDSDLLNKYKKLISGLDNESVHIINDIVSAISSNNIYFTATEREVKLDLQKSIIIK